MTEENDKPEAGAWERQLVEKLALASVTEARRKRRWGIFFKLLTFAYLVAILAMLMEDDLGDVAKQHKEHTALVEVKGLIAPDTEASADNIITGLRDAFKDKKTKGVILRINSPGGSAVQAGYVNDEIKRLRNKHKDIPLYAVISDMCASGGYYIASAADKIYADKASLVGSIGVLMNGFGFVETLEKLGVERRLLTAGTRKGFLDPFSPMKEEDAAHVRSLLEDIHQQFIQVVKDGRGDRLKGGDELFSGLIWTGEQSLKLGLVDELGSSSYVAREVIGVEEIKDYTHEEDVWEKWAKHLGAGATRALMGMGLFGGSAQLR